MTRTNLLFKIGVYALLAITIAFPAWGAMSDEAFVKLCSNGSVHEIQEALRHGANPNASITAYKKGMTPLMAAALNNKYPRVFRILLKAGADINAQNEDGWTALMDAAGHNDNSKIVSALLKAGAKTYLKNNKYQTALDIAEEHLHQDTAKLLKDAMRKK